MKSCPYRRKRSENISYFTARNSELAEAEEAERRERKILERKLKKNLTGPIRLGGNGWGGAERFRSMYMLRHVVIELNRVEISLR